MHPWLRTFCFSVRVGIDVFLASCTLLGVIIAFRFKVPGFNTDDGHNRQILAVNSCPPSGRHRYMVCIRRRSIDRYSRTEPYPISVFSGQNAHATQHSKMSLSSSALKRTPVIWPQRHALDRTMPWSVLLIVSLTDSSVSSMSWEGSVLEY